MSKRNHRREAEGRKPKGRRMPPPSECKMGIQVHETSKHDYEEDIPEVDKCPCCRSFVELEELDEFEGVCFTCFNEGETP